jgi:hypothetical protein
VPATYAVVERVPVVANEVVAGPLSALAAAQVQVLLFVAS